MACVTTASRQAARASATKAASCCWRCWPGCRVRRCALWLLWTRRLPAAQAQWTADGADRGRAGWAFALAVRERVVFPLQTLSNLLGALREGDFSVRGRVAAPGRRAGRSDARGQHAGQHAARAAPGRHGSHHAAAHGDARDRRGDLRLRRAPAAAPGEPRRRAAAGAPAERLLGQTAAELQPGGLPGRPAAEHLADRLSRAARGAGACAARASASAGCRSNWW